VDVLVDRQQRAPGEVLDLGPAFLALAVPHAPALV
jgi:hypothetical protein